MLIEDYFSSNDLNLGEWGEDFVTNYDLEDLETSYTQDTFSEFADNNTSIYYSDIIKYISNHVEEVNDAIAEFGWEGCGSDLYKAGQMAEYRSIENELYDHADDILTAMCLNFAERVLNVEEITDEQLQEIKDACYDHYDDKFGDLIEKVKDILETDEEDEYDPEAEAEAEEFINRVIGEA